MSTTLAPADRSAVTPAGAPHVDPLALVQDAVLVTRRARRLEAQIEKLHERRRQIVAELVRQGLQQREIARLLDISRGRVGQIVQELRAAGELPEDEGTDDA